MCDDVIAVIFEVCPAATKDWAFLVLDAVSHLKDAGLWSPGLTPSL